MRRKKFRREFQNPKIVRDNKKAHDFFPILEEHIRD